MKRIKLRDMLGYFSSTLWYSIPPKAKRGWKEEKSHQIYMYIFLKKNSQNGFQTKWNKQSREVMSWNMEWHGSLPFNKSANQPPGRYGMRMFRLMTPALLPPPTHSPLPHSCPFFPTITITTMFLLYFESQPPLIRPNHEEEKRKNKNTLWMPLF